MIKCKACSGDMELETTKLGYGDEQVDTGQLEILCIRCLGESRRNEPEEYYEGLYKDRHAHYSHYVMSGTLTDLIEGDSSYDWASTAPDGASIK